MHIAVKPLEAKTFQNIKWLLRLCYRRFPGDARRKRRARCWCRVRGISVWHLFICSSTIARPSASLGVPRLPVCHPMGLWKAATPGPRNKAGAPGQALHQYKEQEQAA